MPFQNNWDFGIGPEDATRYTLNFQPVIPFSLGDDWNLITRTIVPVIHQEEAVAGLGDASGLGDILQSFFLSPAQSDPIWGVGPVFLYPSASDDLLGGGKFGVGPTAVLLKQDGPWTYGLLANHVWSVAGESGRDDISASFFQPFITYVTPTRTTFAINSESIYNWEASQWTVPVNANVSQLLMVGKLPVQIGLGGRYYFETPDGGPEWGLRFTITLLFPR